MPNADQNSGIDPNADQFRSMPINSSQCRSMPDQNGCTLELFWKMEKYPPFHEENVHYHLQGRGHWRYECTGFFFSCLWTTITMQSKSLCEHFILMDIQEKIANSKSFSLCNSFINLAEADSERWDFNYWGKRNYFTGKLMYFTTFIGCGQISICTLKCTAKDRKLGK